MNFKNMKMYFNIDKFDNKIFFPSEWKVTTKIRRQNIKYKCKNKTYFTICSEDSQLKNDIHVARNKYVCICSQNNFMNLVFAVAGYNGV